MQKKVISDMQSMQQDVELISKQMAFNHEQQKNFEEIRSELTAQNENVQTNSDQIEALQPFALIKMDEKDMSLSESDDEEEIKDNHFLDHQLRETDKFALIFEEWAKYMLRLDEYRSLKDFLNVISGFDLVSSKSEYFVDGNNAMDMLSDVMGLMGEFDDEQKDENDNTDNPLVKAWDNLSNFDLQKQVNSGWNAMTSYFDDDGDNDDRVREENDKNVNFANKIKHKIKGNVSSFTSWWNSK